MSKEIWFGRKIPKVVRNIWWNQAGRDKEITKYDIRLVYFNEVLLKMNEAKNTSHSQRQCRVLYGISAHLFSPFNHINMGARFQQHNVDQYIVTSRVIFRFFFDEIFFLFMFLV